MIKQRMLSINDINVRYLLINFDRTVCDVFGWTCYSDINIDKNILPKDVRNYNGDFRQLGIKDVFFSEYSEYLTVYRYLLNNIDAYLLTEDDYMENIEILKRNMKWIDGDADEIIWVNHRRFHGYLGAGFDGINNTCELELITHSRLYTSVYMPIKQEYRRNPNKYVHEFVISHKDNKKYFSLYQNYKVMFNYKKALRLNKSEAKSLLSNLTDGVKTYFDRNEPYGVIVNVKYNNNSSDKYFVKSSSKLLDLIDINKLPMIVDIKIIVSVAVKPKANDFHFVFKARNTGEIIGKHIKSFYYNSMEDLFNAVNGLNYNDDMIYVIYGRG